jgi:adenosylmethionine---8-amino-7-oxononanoate aminotransferase
MTAGDAWLARSRASVWHPCTQMKLHERVPLLPLARGEGPWLYDFDGRRYLDAVSSWWVNLFGHAHPRIVAAVTRQLQMLPHAMLAGCTHAPVVELSERLRTLAPAGLGHAFYASDGASATEIALKMSHHYWRNRGQPRKRKFLGLAGGYHGETVGALGVTDVPLFREAYAPLVRVQATVPCPDARGAGTASGRSAADLAREAAAALETELARAHEEVAALIVEPLVQGAAGMVMYDPLYLGLARALCTRYGVHLIADEIMTGFGRTGTLFAWEQAVDDRGQRAAAPDFLCLSKGITGGTLPLSCVLTTNAVYEAFYGDDVQQGFLHSHSYTGNPLACAAALAVLDLFAEGDVIAANRARAGRWAALAAPLRVHPRVRAFRQRGMIAAFEVDSDRPDFAAWCFGKALARNVLLRPIGRTVYFMPPYVVDDHAFAGLVDATLDIVGAA